MRAAEFRRCLQRSDAALIPAEPNCCSAALEELSSAPPAAKPASGKSRRRNSKWSRAAAFPAVKPDAEAPERRRCNLPGSLGANWPLLLPRDNIFRAADLEICGVKPNSSGRRRVDSLLLGPSGGKEPPAGDLRGLSGGSLCCTRGPFVTCRDALQRRRKTWAGKKKELQSRLLTASVGLLVCTTPCER